MPNHVFNTMTVTGSPEEIQRFRDTAKSTYINQFYDWSETSNERVLVTNEVTSEFSFRGFVPTPTENYEDYFDENGKLVQNWWRWNVDNWGTKWDAYDVYIDEGTEPTRFSVSFTTAWSQPDPVFRAMFTQFPELSFSVRYEEEQGWGGTIDIVSRGNDYVVTETSWDIPNSHAEEKEIGRECVCDYESDQTYWYSDCPKEEELVDA